MPAPAQRRIIPSTPPSASAVNSADGSALESSGPSQQQQSQDSAVSFAVRAILDERVSGSGQPEYLIDWEDNGPISYSPSWEPVGNVSAPDLEREYRERCKAACHGISLSKPRPSNPRIPATHSIFIPDSQPSPQPDSHVRKPFVSSAQELTLF
jgi:Chromo (CHRromatin Organisation MOdifier) domain